MSESESRSESEKPTDTFEDLALSIRDYLKGLDQELRDELRELKERVSKLESKLGYSKE